MTFHLGFTFSSPVETGRQAMHDFSFMSLQVRGNVSLLFVYVLFYVYETPLPVTAWDTA